MIWSSSGLLHGAEKSQTPAVISPGKAAYVSIITVFDSFRETTNFLLAFLGVCRDYC
jgi:hypothetical protein